MHLNGNIRSAAAYTFTEVMVAVGVVGLMLVSLYLGIATSFATIQRARENLRATQILVQRVETVRLYTWDQLRNVGANKYLQTSFTEYYDPYGASGGGGGVLYHGTVQVTTNPPYLKNSGVSYSPNVAVVSVNLLWTNGLGSAALPHARQFQTLVARNGMQKYVYGD
jgi:type II secretory pathway pseudopilin PulG